MEFLIVFTGRGTPTSRHTFSASNATETMQSTARCQLQRVVDRGCIPNNHEAKRRMSCYKKYMEWMRLSCRLLNRSFQSARLKVSSSLMTDSEPWNCS